MFKYVESTIMNNNTRQTKIQRLEDLYRIQISNNMTFKELEEILLLEDDLGFEVAECIASKLAGYYD